MTSRRARGVGLVLASLLALAGFRGARAEPLRVSDALLEPVATDAIPGFPGPDPATALAHFRALCDAPGKPQLPSGPGLSVDLAEACEAARRTAPEGAASFFTERFEAFRILRPQASDATTRRKGFLTGYFEPELEGALEASADFSTPVLARPDDLVSLEPGETRPGLPEGLRAARAAGEGFEPYPDRAAIEDGALGARARPLLYLRDLVDLFVLQVQGSGRVRLRDGSSLRVLYDGRNGRPYTSVGKLIVTEGHLPLDGLTLARWTGWLRANPETGRRLMRRNASYIFFRTEPVADAALGPPGAAGVPLVPGRSLAVDAGLWRYGLPFWLEGTLPGAGGGEPGRLVIAADTGSAIVGPARGDLYVGTGAAAGAAAGDLRDAVGFVVLIPRRAPAP